MPDPRYRVNPNLDKDKMDAFMQSLGQSLPQEQPSMLPAPSQNQQQGDPAVEALRQLQMEAEQERLRKLREGLRGSTDPGTSVPIAGGSRIG